MPTIDIKLRLHRIAAILLRIGFLPFFTVRISGREYLPPRGGYILLPKHQRWEDIPMMALTATRPLYFIAKMELFRFPWPARLMTFLGGIPLDRENPMRSRNSLKTALAVLKRGEPLVIFPEGTYFINRMGPGREGMVRFILSRSGNTFVPVGIHYRRNGLRTDVDIRIGRPVATRPTREARAFLDDMMTEIARLSGLEAQAAT
ncbi:MAG: lysophospholipid acyltransferase family protein [Thermodesulfobacteriota bacterium]